MWRPNPGPQEAFLRSAAWECLYGGAAGGGKSDALLAEALRQIATSQYRAAIFRRTYPELEQSGGLIDRSKALYPALGGIYSEMRHRWTFPSGALIDLCHMQRDDDRLKYQGAQYAYIAFDELTHFTEKQYLYLFSRCRAPAGGGLRCYMRGGTNPGGPGHEWVKKRWGAWLDRKHDCPAGPGELRHCARVDDVDTEVGASHPDARSRTFIPARVSDNPYLANTDYERNLRLLQLVERLRLLEGDWDVMAIAGNVFKREWFGLVDVVSVHARRCRFWELAATEKKATGDDPDFTAGARLAELNGIFTIEHMIKVRARWLGVKQLIAQTAQLDGRKVMVGIEQEPGASGKALVSEIIRMPELSGYTVRAYRPREDKLTRANPWSAQAEAGNMKILRGNWDIEGLLNSLAGFPDWPHDDEVDALSGAYCLLSRRRRRRVHD